MVDDGHLEVVLLQDVEHAAGGVDAAHARRRAQQHHGRIQILDGAMSGEVSHMCKHNQM